MHEHDDPDFDDDSHAQDDDLSREGAEVELSSWVLDLRNRFAERASMSLPAGVEPSVALSDDPEADFGEEAVLPRVVFLVGVCVVDQELRVALTVDLTSEEEILEAALPIREALGDGEDGEDPFAEWFAPLEGWVDVDPGADPTGEADEDDGTAERAGAGDQDDPVWGAATALVREAFTEDAHLALRVGELDDQLVIGRRCVGAVVALPRRVLEPLVEVGTVQLVTLPQLADPDLLEEHELEVDGVVEQVPVAFIEERRIASSSYQVLLGLVQRLGLGEEDQEEPS